MASVASKDPFSYSDDSTHRCERVLGTVFRYVGAPWSARMCLVGGLAPRFLLPSAGVHDSGHVGSTDVDLALRVAVGSADAGAYRTLEKNLKRAGLRRYDASKTAWRWYVELDGVKVRVELLGDDGTTPSGETFRPKIEPPAGAGHLGLLCVRGVDLALLDCVIVEREIELLDGVLGTVSIRVAGLTPLVALKADAYLDRGEPKDVYDLLHLLRHWPGGPRAAAAVALSSPVFRQPFVSVSLDRLDAEFKSRAHAGPVHYARFVTKDGTAGDYEAARDDALLVWSIFTRAIGLGDAEGVSA